jgi:hypothetical protein
MSTPLESSPHFGLKARAGKKLELKVSTSVENYGKFLLIYICNFHVLSHLLLIFICKLHWNCLGLGFETWHKYKLGKGQVASFGNFLLIYICNFHVLSHLLLIFICKPHWYLNTMFVCQVNYF